MSELTRSVGLLSGQRIVLVILGALRNKIAAMLLGPAGMGLLGQATSFRDLLTALASFGSRNGYLKLVAEHRGRDDRRGLENLIVTTLTVVTTISVVVALLSTLGASAIAEHAFGDAGQAPLVVLAAITVVVALPASAIQRTFAGSLDFRTFVQVAVIEATISVIAMAALAYQFGIEGAVGSFALVGTLTLVIAGVLLWRRIARPLGLDLRPRRPDPVVVRRLAKLASALTVTSLCSTAAGVFVRAQIIRELGVEANGFYQVAWLVGQNALGILGSGIWGYGMPKVATRLDDPEAVLGLQNQFLRIGLTLLAPGIVLLLVTREVWVPILFTHAFLAAGSMICWQLMGELLAMMRQSMNITLLPREKLGFLVFQAAFYWGVFAALVFGSISWLGAEAAAISYFAANVIALVVSYGYHRTTLGYRLSSESLVLLAWAFPAFLIASVLALGDGWILARLVPGAMALLSLYVNRGAMLRVLRG